MTKLPFIVLIGGITGMTAGLILQWWTNASNPVDFLWLPTWLQGYNFRISGKPDFSLPANIPVIFELTILLSAFATVGGMFVMNNLPWFYNALFTSRRFARVTNDRFFISIEARDPKFAESETYSFAESLGGTHVEKYYDVATPSLPSGLHWIIWVTVALLLIPPAVVLKMRFSYGSEPRIEVRQDMGNQERYKAQQENARFADTRGMRPVIADTVARGDFLNDPHYTVGGELGNDPNTGKLKMTWFNGFPERVKLDRAALERGRERFDIYCATCHGYDGKGNGPTNLRGIELAASGAAAGWVPAVNLHDELRRERPDGHIFNSITNGIRNMAGYGDQISIEDRWKIVAYVRALQRSTTATIEDVPADQRTTLR
jgi:mono/diheme cytochrome c family protein